MLTLARTRRWFREMWPWFAVLALAALAVLGSRKARLALDVRARHLRREQERKEQERRSQNAILNQAKREALEARAREQAAGAKQRTSDLEALERDRAVSTELRELPSDEAVERLKRNIKPWLAILLVLLPMPARADEVCVPRHVIDASNAAIEYYRDRYVPVLLEHVGKLADELATNKEALAASKAIEAEAVSQARQDRAAASEDREERRDAEKSKWRWVGGSAGAAAIVGFVIGLVVTR